jgi:hypothetical protein
VFYEDFTDRWRCPENALMRYAQRIDVDEWQHYAPDGITMKGLSKVPPYELQKAVFEIRKDHFEKIVGRLQLASGQSNEVGEGLDDTAIEVLEKKQASGQGFLLDSKLRKALEDYAMDAAKRYFESHGYVVEDRSKGRPYDLRCTGKKGLLYVEVKGTQTNGEEVFLTSGEVQFARCHKGQMALFLVRSIKVSEDGKILTNGQEDLILPWDVDQGFLKPVSYKYEVPKSTIRERT